MAWTDDSEQLLRARWAAGMTASAIAAEIGGDMTRSAVLGKVHRLKLTPREPKPAPTRQERMQRQQRRLARLSHTSAAPDGERVRHVPQAHYQPPKTRRFIDPSRDEYGLQHCNFPLNGFDGPNDADMPMCDSIAKSDSSYCEVHHEICYPKPPPRRPPGERQRVNNIITDPRRRPAFISEGV